MNCKPDSGLSFQKISSVKLNFQNKTIAEDKDRHLWLIRRRLARFWCTGLVQPGAGLMMPCTKREL